MSQTPYLRMIDRMNKNGAKHHPTDSLVRFLQELYTENQADLIADFPLGAYTSEALSEKLGRNEGDLRKMLEEMSAEGLIFEAPDENGEPEYSVLPFEPGLMELQFIKGKDDERTRKFLELFRQIGLEERSLMQELLSKPEEAKKAMAYPGGRIIAVEEHVSGDKELANWEKVSGVIESETSFAVGECSCKHAAKLRGTPCRTEGPSNCCIWFGKLADYLVERDYAVRYEKEAVYKLLKECEDAGLVHFMGNNLGTNRVLCNCCKCCCSYLKSNKVVRQLGIQFTETSNFVCRVDEESCLGCGECVEICQLDALSVNDDTVKVNEQYCLGCGSCVSKCPTASLSLVRISNKKPKMPHRKIVGAGV